jgi:hypothetical protein
MRRIGRVARRSVASLRLNRYDMLSIGILLSALLLSGAFGADSNPQSTTVATQAAPSIQPVPLLPTMDYHYDVSWGGMGVGQMQVSLKAGDKPDCYRYEAISHPSALAAMLYGSPNETSLFCVKDGAIRSQHFESVLPSDDKQSYQLDFDWDKRKVFDSKNGPRDIPADAIDSFALQQAVRLWVVQHAKDANPPIAEFTMVDHKNLTHYQFRLMGHEPVQTAAGKFDTIRLERIDNPAKVGRFWLAPDRGYMPVVIETKSGGKPTVRMELAP